MQKKLIALAIAGLSSAAFAQSNVTIYGVADGTFDSVKATGAASGLAANDYGSRSRVSSNSSFIGFKGSEKLGNGMSAIFQFENGLQTENGAAGAWNNRDSFVGLTGGFGTVVLGNITGPTRALGAKMDVNAGATGIGANTALLGKIGGGTGASAFDQRISNAVAYVSPNFNGITATIGYMANENKSLNTDPLTADTKAVTGGISYENGPIYAAYAYTKVDPVGSTSDTKSNRLGVKYSAGNFTVGALWDKAEIDTATKQKRTAWYLPVTFNVTPAGKILFQYGHAGNVEGTDADEGAKHVVLGYEHSLSKRTVVKALYSQITNKTGGSYDYLYGVTNGNSTATAIAGFGAGADPKGFSVGIRHSF